MPKKHVTVHYRRLGDRNFNPLPHPLRDCIAAALQANIGGVVLGASDAARITTSAEGRRMCLLNPNVTANMVFGEVAVFREGDIPIAETDAAGQVTLKTIALGAQEEAVLGASYFLAHGNDVAIVHNESGTRFLRDYFNWIAKQPLGQLAQDEVVQLLPVASAQGKPVGIKDVKSLRLRAEMDHHGAAPPIAHQAAVAKQASFSRFVDRLLLHGPAARQLLGAFGLSDGTVGGLSDADLEDLEFELVVKKREKRNLEILPQSIIDGVFSDGVDQAAEFETAGATRRGDAFVIHYRGEIELDGAYFELAPTYALLFDAMDEWRKQGMI